MTKTTTELHDFARQLHNWGASVTAIKRGTKHPVHKWKQWQSRPQTLAELDALPWHRATAIGIVNGRGDFRVFDIDAVKDANDVPVSSVPESIVGDLLTALGLPSDYQWSYRSGSGAGFGVVIRCAEPLPPDWAAGKGVYVGRPADGRPFGQLELRWATGQTVIDGAHPTGPGYQWRRGERPFVPPALCTAAQVVTAFTAIAENVADSCLTTTASSPAGLVNESTSAAVDSADFYPPIWAMEKYAAAALADAIQKVSTAAPGDRNNTLFRQTAALAALVNSGILTRSDVEREMNNAALADGLTIGETNMTIKSAFKTTGTKARMIKPSANGNNKPSTNLHFEEGEDQTVDVAQLSGVTVVPFAPSRVAFKPDDTGNAERFVDQHGDEVRYNHSTKHWLIWSGTHWRQDGDGEIQRRAKATVRAICDEAATASRMGNDGLAEQLRKWERTSASESRRRAMLNLAMAEQPIALANDRLNTHDLLLNVQNGTLDLTTGQLLAHDRRDLLTYVLPVPYAPEAHCPTWNIFLGKVTNGNSALADYLARAVGYTLSGLTTNQCLFFLYGRGANGKSTFIETVLALLGDLSCKARAQVLMLSNRGQIPNDVAALAGRRLVVTSEFGDICRLDEGLVKDLTGGDTTSSRFLFKEWFSFRPTFKLWLYGNYKPMIMGTDDGIWRRVQLIPFTVQIPEKERDSSLPAKLRAELPGILAWAVRGWQDFQQQGLRTPTVVAEATAAYRIESDTLGQFLAECCHMDAGARARGGELHEAYTAWVEQNGLRPISAKQLGAALRDKGFTNARDGRGHYWRGISLLMGG